MDAILIVDADAALSQTIRRTLGDGFRFLARKEDSAAAPAAVIVAINDAASPADTIKPLMALGSPVIALVSSARVQDAVSALKAGATDVLELPIDLPRLPTAVQAALKAANPKAIESLTAMATLASPDLEKMPDQDEPGPEGVQFKEGRRIIGSSDSLKKVFALIAKLAKVETTVLVRGESGTGKELVAQALHYNSDRCDGPFVSVNCGAIPDTLIESELFGHEKGAFTGADRKKTGKFEHAQGGTIFLDEIGDISPQMQVKLLRVLQEKKFIPLGSHKEVAADVRVISATNKPLEEMITKEEFRSDLFYRLNVLPIHLPPLRERKGDIEKLAMFLIAKFNRIHCRDIRSIAPDALGALQRYSWPGNVRELENAIEHGFIMETSQRLSQASLPRIVTEAKVVIEEAKATASNEISKESPVLKDVSQERGNGKALPAQPVPQPPLMTKEYGSHQAQLKYPALKEQFEKWFLEEALKAHNGRINQTAEGTQMTKVTLLRKLQKYGIDPKQYRH